uniref:RNA-directed DNA polymerase, eukaryota, reverse transcriptase zinc-binding domain protein n=1 Tax=Tanacetum cinerariifolium TaxID=118510 RepID=A0A6L2JNB0_TANCI|nr:hypothetical protein [Tanacetum cinerariifolium]
MKSHWKTQIDGHNMFKVISKMKLLKKPLQKLLHDHGNLHERDNKLRLEFDEVKKALDTKWADPILREEECVYIQAFKRRNLMRKEVSGSLVLVVFVSHYEQFLGSSTDCNILNEEGFFSNKVSTDIASNMVRDVTNDEIKAAVFNIGDDRAPCPYGYTSIFFKKGWNIVGDDVCNVSWPQSWLLKALDLGLITYPSLVSLVADLWQWHDRNGNISSFSVAKAWEAIRPRVMRHGLKTHDKMRQWDVGGDTDLNLLRCALCDNCPDSHMYLFFKCTFSAKV